MARPAAGALIPDLLQKLDLAGSDPILAVEVDPNAQLGQRFDARARHDEVSRMVAAENATLAHRGQGERIVRHHRTACIARNAFTPVTVPVSDGT